LSATAAALVALLFAQPPTCFVAAMSALQAAELDAQLEAAAEERSRLEQYASKLEAEVCRVLLL
jgi:hypothetical protein